MLESQVSKSDSLGADLADVKNPTEDSTNKGMKVEKTRRLIRASCIRAIHAALPSEPRQKKGGGSVVNQIMGSLCNDINAFDDETLYTAINFTEAYMRWSYWTISGHPQLAIKLKSTDLSKFQNAPTIEKSVWYCLVSFGKQVEVPCIRVHFSEKQCCWCTEDEYFGFPQSEDAQRLFNEDWNDTPYYKDGEDWIPMMLEAKHHPLLFYAKKEGAEDARSTRRERLRELRRQLPSSDAQWSIDYVKKAEDKWTLC